MWPDDRDRPCIWMTAGMVSYRLCDRDFDCQNCLFDAAMRGEAGTETLRRLGADALEPPAWRFPDDRTYCTCHGWVQPTADGASRVGIDAFAASVLGRLRGVEAPEEGADVRAGEPYADLHTRYGTLRLRAPVGGRVTRVNPRLERDPTRVTAAPYRSGWLVELEPREDGSRRAPVLEAGETMQKRALMDLRRLRRKIGMQLLEMAGRVGPTMADGGIRLTDVSAMVGPARYLRLIAEALGATI